METSSQNNKNSALFQKYLAGECSKDEIQILEQWYGSFDHSPLPEIKQEKLALNRAKKSLLNKIRVDILARWQIVPLSVSFRIAAILTLVGSISLLIYFAANSRPEYQQELHAENGKIKVFTLSDGSTVTLNSGSTLKVTSDFREVNRTVELSGEAYFQVSKDASRPFIVNAGTISTRVLGTAFNVQAYKNEGFLTVTVAEGKVKVHGTQANLSKSLTPGKQLIYNKNHQTSQVLDANAEHVSSWRNGTLYFDNASIPDIAKRLERTFNVKINVIGDVKANCRYTLRITDETFEKTLKLLTTVSGISYKTNQPNQITINTKSCK